MARGIHLGGRERKAAARCVKGFDRPPFPVAHAGLPGYRTVAVPLPSPRPPRSTRWLLALAALAASSVVAAAMAAGCSDGSTATAYLGAIDRDAAPEVQLGGPDVGAPDAGLDDASFDGAD